MSGATSCQLLLRIQLERRAPRLRARYRYKLFWIKRKCLMLRAQLLSVCLFHSQTKTWLRLDSSVSVREERTGQTASALHSELHTRATTHSSQRPGVLPQPERSPAVQLWPSLKLRVLRGRLQKSYIRELLGAPSTLPAIRAGAKIGSYYIRFGATSIWKCIRFRAIRK